MKLLKEGCLRGKDYAAWYHELIKEADLAEQGAVRGSMIIKPYGFSIWEEIKLSLDKTLKSVGYKNVYFPLLIPAHYMGKEAAHVEGFAKECAVVTHYRLKLTLDKKGVEVDPAAQLESPLVIRPTSETTIWSAFSRWIQSYRDLPMRVNQWANVVRWEMRPRPFLRSSEILWQEGHTAHEKAKEAQDEARKVLGLYANFLKEVLALPLIEGEKTAHERFAGAEATYTMEGLMQDGKALQLGTTHFLGQNFSKAFNVVYRDAQNKESYAWGSSWGLTTRLIGAIVMVHGDDKGLVLPPRVAPIQVVIIAVMRKPSKALFDYIKEVEQRLIEAGFRVQLDANEQQRPGAKFNAYERKGVPLRIVIGAREAGARKIELVCRDNSAKSMVSFDTLVATINTQLIELQKRIYQKAVDRQVAKTISLENYQEFKKVAKERLGFVLAHWDGTTTTEKAIQAETGMTIRCLPFKHAATTGRCIYSGKPSLQQALFAKAY